MGCVVFNLITTPCKPHEILAIIIIRRITDGFMRATSQILNAVIVTLETSKSRCNSLDYQAEGYAENLNYDHNINVMYPTNSMSKFTIIFRFCLMKEISC